MTLIIIIPCLVSWVLLVKIATHKGMILERVGTWAKNNVDRYKVLEGLVLCEWCMPFIHSLFVFSLLFLSGVVEPDVRLLFLYPFILGASSFCSGMLWLIYETLYAKKELYKKNEILAHFEIKNKKQLHFKKTNYGKQKKHPYS